MPLRARRPIWCTAWGIWWATGPTRTRSINFVRERGIPTVMGNYDEGVGYDLNDCGCSYRDPDDRRLGQLSLEWTRQVTTAEGKDYLRALPMQIRLEDDRPTLLLVHGSPRSIKEYLYEDRGEVILERMAKLAGTDVLLFGHTHLPYARWVGRTLLVNTGSVGKPKDGDPRAGYVMLTLGRRPKAEFRRVAYDVEGAAKAIRDSELPDHFADLLQSGGEKPIRAAIEAEALRGES